MESNLEELSFRYKAIHELILQKSSLLAGISPKDLEADKKSMLEFIKQYCNSKRGNIRKLSQISNTNEKLIANSIRGMSDKIGLDRVITLFFIIINGNL
jgi:hypothetical protein